MKDDTKTGLGYGPLSIRDRVFEAMARVHDWGYLKGSDSQETMSRSGFDEQTIYNFGSYLARQELIRDLERKTKPRAFGEYIARRGRLLFYYGVVKIFGGLFWEGPTQQQTTRNEGPET